MHLLARQFNGIASDLMRKLEMKMSDASELSSLYTLRRRVGLLRQYDEQESIRLATPVMIQHCDRIIARDEAYFQNLDEKKAVDEANRTGEDVEYAIHLIAVIKQHWARMRVEERDIIYGMVRSMLDLCLQHAIATTAANKVVTGVQPKQPGQN